MVVLSLVELRWWCCRQQLGHGSLQPVTKLPGSEVAAGSTNLNGTLTIEVRRSGKKTAIGNIVRLVEEAQSREAPVQRLADKVSGHFTYGVMALSAATFMFWNLFGAKMLPAALYQGSSASLALQLSCSVLEGVGRTIQFGVVMLFEHTRAGEFDFARNYLLQQ